MFAGKQIPEPATLRDDYATRTDAIRECRQKVFDDLNRRDLKLEPPADLKGPALNQWLNVKPMELTVDGKTLTGKELVKWKYQRYMRDYLGDHAFWCDPNSIDSIADALVRAMSQPKDFTLAEIIRRRFTWHAAAAQTLAGYEKVLVLPRHR
jgi:hypothetical protein